MKIASATLVFFLAGSSEAFAPLHAHRLTTGGGTRSLALKPVHDLPQHLSDVLTSFNLADAIEGAGGVVDVAETAVKASGNGWFGFLVGPISGILEFIHTLIVSVGVNTNAWGISIIVLTLLIKAVTFPLTQSQMESTQKMQAISPKIKEIQAKYQSNPEVMNQKVAEFYQVNEINPLAGCIPSFVQIPVFIGLYRAVLTLAQENKLDEPFLFLPNLEGPTYGADPAHGSDWILQGWTDAGPSLGWTDTISFLILPVLLVISQFASMELMQPKSDDPAQKPNVVLKILPLMIGWFALNVPAALSVYWVINNFVTTGTSVYLKSQMKFEPAAPESPSTSSSATVGSPTTIFAPPREKPSGFGQSTERSMPKDGVKPITAIDAEIVESTPEESGSESEATVSEASRSKKSKRGKKRKN
eukprot:CAMPEP_0198136664 /NCGR_PEP_ID=MMETSP1443-20131203/297_1 /TAXON_ID=186043 /ORGANISM="Entomoneis sp., Strain CCMP2396" /LENGTH=415 /DNA_ID=CAMNT_0043797921 /DNA_START=65 /DNA_END=1312 /DNA_ORIENTATION=-